MVFLGDPKRPKLVSLGTGRRLLGGIDCLWIYSGNYTKGWDKHNSLEVSFDKKLDVAKDKPNRG